MPVAPYAIDPPRLTGLLERYQRFDALPLSYGTVRDFCDSSSLLPELTAQGDLKDVQRAWVFKAIVAHIPRGAHVLEIGAGDPHVAHWLATAGYRVTVVDPYDGSGNGPTEYEYYRHHFPGIAIRRERFTDQLADLAPGSVDCVYSVSVLEHIPHDQLAGVIAGIQRFQKPGRPTIHAVDHVLKGWLGERHQRTLEMLCAGFGLTPGDLAATLARAAQDTETYFLSAESHNRWRGERDYDSFAMRRCISVQFCTELPPAGRQLTSHPPSPPVESGRAMNPEPAELIQRLRQQLILAQVRIMELEDARDESAPKLADADRLIAAAQDLADRKVDEAAHLEKVRADLQAQFEHMRHMQHVTNEALNKTRAELAADQQALATAREAQDGLLLQLGRAQEELLALEHSLRTAQTEARDRGARIAQLDAEQRAMKASRSWRWTAWLRSLERAFGGRR